MSSATSFSQEQKQQQHCCLSHEFYKAATKNPPKLAVIHASSSGGGGDDVGGPQIPKKLINGGGSTAFASSSPAAPVYERDQCFTFDNILNSVDSLTSRLRSILYAKDNHGEKLSVAAEKTNNAYRPKIIGIYMPPSVEYVISVLSILRCGEAFLPLDPSWPKDRVLSIVSCSNNDLVITSASSFGKGKSSDYDCDWDWGCPVLCFSMEDSFGALNLEWPCEKEKQRSFCYLMYTSGSTGKPKGVCGTEQGLLNRFLWMQELYPLHGEEVLLFKTSISFVDHLQEFLGAMLSGCTLVIPPFDEMKKYPFSVVNFLQDYSINRLTAVPSLMRTILPAFQSQYIMRIQSSLKLLILSGEVFPLSLWDALSKLLPRTSILNLYGSTEVSGDCTYFDCKNLPTILEREELTTIPIGVPIFNCDVELICENDTPNQGEIYVGGLCVSNGYLSESTATSFDYVKVHKSFICNCSVDDCGAQIYYKTGDFARWLECGELVFLGRIDRTIKVNGQRIALEEIENTLRVHPDVVDAAVISREGLGKPLLLEAFLLLKEKDRSGDFVRSSIRSWMVGKVPLTMIPSRFVFTESFPMSSSGKVDYTLLESTTIFSRPVEDKSGINKTSDLLQVIKKAFCDALMVEEISSDGDFFMMGGNSIAAAHVSYNLGIDMRLLYNFPTPSKLYTALLGEKKSCSIDLRTDSKLELNLIADTWNVSYSPTPNLLRLTSPEHQLKNPLQKNDDRAFVSKRLKASDKYISSKYVSQSDGYPWSASRSISMSCSFSRCNKVMYKGDYNTCRVNLFAEVPGNRKGSTMQELWKVHMESCVDASPLVVFKDRDVYLFIGSHAHKFICVNAKSGSVQWEVKLEGRIECSAAIVGDFSQVVVGCYKGKIYFLDFFNGNICWTFQTSGEVKSQPVVDVCRQLIWCGSHDHNLYAFDYKKHCCIYKLPCGGSIFGSPAIDEVHDKLYVATTSGCVTAILIKALPFYTLWQHELEVPLFGSLSVSSPSGNVICCLVDGNIVVLDLNGSVVWRHKTGGPIFAGACTSCVLPSQMLICSRSGSVYSFELEKGELLWEYNVGDPITACAYVDEHLQLVSGSSLLSDRLVCICTSSGSIHLLSINLDVAGKENQPSKNMVQEFARLGLPGDIFSSPVMVGGRIFVGCRDDYVHCIAVETQSSMEE